MRDVRVILLALLGAALAVGCTNNPYPDADRDQKVLYSSFHEAPKTLDPAVAYTHRRAHHHRQRLRHAARVPLPRAALPADSRPAEDVPEPVPRPTAAQVYRFQIRHGMLFHADPCFALEQDGRHHAAGHRRRFRVQLWRASPTPPSTVPWHPKLRTGSRASQSSASGSRRCARTDRLRGPPRP